MSLVVFPFKDEDPNAVARNLATAAGHHRVEEVWAVAAEDSAGKGRVQELAEELASATGKPLRVLGEERVGKFRSGKGDAMNTAIRRAAEESWERVHFYDADIVNFDGSWIEGAEAAADEGFGVVRHRFPRAATDAMITWMVTRPSLALLFPGTFLPRLDQPLGGELLLTAPALEGLAVSDLVGDRSDWGIDTVITYACSVMGLGLYEHHVADGKRHTLYGSLAELRPMVLECLDAVVSLVGLPGPDPEARHGSDSPTPVPDDLRRTVAYDLDATLPLLAAPWVDGERELAADLPDAVRRALDRAEPRPMDADHWLGSLQLLHSGFRLGDGAWESLAFRLWVHRVVAYTIEQATKGYEQAIAYLESTIHRYERAADHP